MPAEALIAAKRRNQNLTRGIETLFKKAHGLGKDYGVDVAMIIKKKGRYYTYRSTDRATWPPSIAEVVSKISQFSVVRLTYLGQQNTYPLPKNLLPYDLEEKATKCKPPTRIPWVSLGEQSM
jgi:hypothetical protein